MRPKLKARKTFCFGLPPRRAGRREVAVEPLEGRTLLTSATYHNGPVMQNVQVETIYVGSQWTDPTSGLAATVSNMDNFFKTVTNSGYMDQLNQYGVARGSFTGHDFINVGPSSGFIDGKYITAGIDAEIAAGRVPAPGPNTLYFAVVQPGLDIGTAGYHNQYSPGRYFAAINYSTNPDFMTLVGGHELVEAATDPAPGGGWFQDSDGEELADLGQGHGEGYVGGFVVQTIWNQADQNYTIEPDATALPPGWFDSDIGGQTQPGSVTLYAGGATWSVAGVGADIYGAADQFNFAASSLTGDGTIVARIGSQMNSGAWAKAGIMLRVGNTPNAPFIDLYTTPTAGGNTIQMEDRASAGAAAAIAGAVAGSSAPQWVRIVRSRNTFTGAISSDGAKWTTVGATVLSLPTTLAAGLAVSSYAAGKLGAATFTNVSVTSPSLAADSGFESPATAGYVYDPTGSPWRFNGAAGVSSNGTGFTGGNPSAPEGTQVAFLQGSGSSICQTILGLAAGTYQIQFSAAQRGASNHGGQDFKLLVDGNAVGSYLPPTSTYAIYTVNVTLAQGAHSIGFASLDSAGGDNTAFIDNVSVTRVPVLPTLVNGGFETPAQNGAYTYDPTGAGWTFAGASGIAANNSGFTAGNSNAPEGQQVAFLQNTGSFSQTVTGWLAGAYKLSFSAAQRGASNNGGQNFELLVDGNVASVFTPSSATYARFNATLTLAAGAHTLAFVGLDTVGGDNTALIDNVQISSVPTIVNAGFESPPQNGGFAYDPTGAGWTFAGHSGVTGNHNAFTSGTAVAPQGTQAAFVQDTGSISQTISGGSAGVYSLTFSAAQRGSFNAASQDFSLLLDGALIGAFTPAAALYQTYTVVFDLTTGPHTLTFAGTDTAGGDNTAFIDNVMISAL